MPEYDMDAVENALNEGADLVICLPQREIFRHPDVPAVPDRPVAFCGCDPHGNCGCFYILKAACPQGGFTQGLTVHRRAATCGPDTAMPSEAEDLYALTNRNHRWSDSRDQPRPQITGKPGSDRVERLAEVCPDCKLVRITTKLLPMIFVNREIIMDALITDQQVETIATWLHDATNDRMMPCTTEQHIFAIRHTLDREQEYAWR